MRSYIWTIAGTGITAISASADFTGLGQEATATAEFGYLQWLGTILGVICLLGGFVTGRPRKNDPTT